ncbi:Holliday junction resolvase RecU [Holzapfeliella sp. JNUCC 80]
MINYPNGGGGPSSISKDNGTNAFSFSKRGMSLEQEINDSNDYYLHKGIAVIHKKPTPIQIVNVDYPKRSRAVIKEAYFRQASTTDYNGVYNGYYVDFEAKETRNKTSFPLKNFHQHQITHFENCLSQKGICFVIIKFASLNRYFSYPASRLIKHWYNQEASRKSIKLDEVVDYGIEFYPGFRPTLPYLETINNLIQRIEYDK